MNSKYAIWVAAHIDFIRRGFENNDRQVLAVHVWLCGLEFKLKRFQGNRKMKNTPARGIIPDVVSCFHIFVPKNWARLGYETTDNVTNRITRITFAVNNNATTQLRNCNVNNNIQANEHIHKKTKELLDRGLMSCRSPVKVTSPWGQFEPFQVFFRHLQHDHDVVQVGEAHFEVQSS